MREPVPRKGAVLTQISAFWFERLADVVPSHFLTASTKEILERIPGLAGSSTVTPDWSPVAKRIRDEATDDWNDKVAVDRLVGKGAQFVRGTARIVGPGTRPL